MFELLRSKHRSSAVLCATAMILAACSDTPVTPKGPQPGVASRDQGQGLAMKLEHARVCPGNSPGDVTCHAIVGVDADGQPFATSGPSGLVPADLQAAYNLAAVATTNGGSATIAIVDAYDDGNAESDLAVYRKQFNLGVCSTTNGCFKKVNQSGGKTYPRGDAGWAEEISLDLDMASAICPKCHILLVEASSNSFANLSAAVDYAASVPGVVAISNSYGGNEFSGETSQEAHYNHPGIAVTVSSGDNGYGVEFPASSQYVIAVGGTSLKRNSSSRGWTETAWSGAGSGCSKYIGKPPWQTDISGCSNRTVADVSAVADPNTGVSVYDTYRLIHGGWLVFGGTSVAAPIIAGVSALGGYASAQIFYTTAPLYDVTSGSNGSCGGSYLCTAGAGFDGPTGNGTPRGVGGP